MLVINFNEATVPVTDFAVVDSNELVSAGVRSGGICFVVSVVLSFMFIVAPVVVGCAVRTETGNFYALYFS